MINVEVASMKFLGLREVHCSSWVSVLIRLLTITRDDNDNTYRR